MASQFKHNENTEDIIAHSLKTLDAVSLQVGFKALFNWLGKGIPPSQTFWQIVFDLSDMKIHFKTKNQRAVQTIDVSAFDYTPHTAVKVLNIDSNHSGNVTELFRDYQHSDNARIVKKALNRLRIRYPKLNNKKSSPTLNYSQTRLNPKLQRRVFHQGL